jgi:hypothetical protein
MKALKSLTKKQKRNLIIVLVVIVLAYLVYNEWLKKQRTRVKFDPGNIPTLGTGVNGQAIPWNPEPLAREIYTNLEGWNFFYYIETSEKVLDLNNDQLIYLYNYYNQYLASEYDSVTKLFEAEWNGHTGINGARYDEVAAKFKALGLN